MARTTTVLLLVIIVVLAGCSGAGGDGGNAGGGDGGEPGATFAGGDGGAGGNDGSGGGNDGGNDGGDAAMGVTTGVAHEQSAIQLQRQLILTGEIRLRVEDFEEAQSNLTTLAESHGGFVSDSTQEVSERDNQTQTQGTVVIRVPRENFTALFQNAQAVGTVQQATRQSEDVTDKLVDLEARLENLRAERDRLRTLYERANTTEDILEVQERLSEVQGDIESLEARIRSLRNQVAYSTITVHMQEPRPDDPFAQQHHWWEISLVQAFLQSVDGVVTTLRALAVGIAFALPYVLVFVAPVAGGALLYRRRKR